MSVSKGVYTALLTPYYDDGKINPKELEKLIKYNIEVLGVNGFYVSGSTGEAFMLSIQERKLIFDVAADTAKGECTIIAHVGSIATKDALSLAEYAEKLGFDAVSSVAPFYYKFTIDEIKEHYMSLASSVNLPVFIYNIPDFSGVALGTDDLGYFLSDKRFAGVKHTSSNFFQLERIKNKYPEKLIFNGYDEMFMAGMAMGADGGICSTSNFMADKFVAIIKHMEKGELEEARAIQKVANDIIAVLLRLGVLVSVKEIVGNLGFRCNPPRRPFKPLDGEGKEMIKKIMPLIIKG